MLSNIRFVPRTFDLLKRATLFTSPLSFDEEPAEAEEKPVDPSKDRRNPVSVETSIAYLESEGYQKTYQGNLIWTLYRRNHKKQFAPPTRKRCIRQGIISTGSPCPICRDEYLIPDYRNIKLLQQFISPHNGAILKTSQTGVCQRRQQELLVAILKARNLGLLTFDVPFRSYDYSLYNQGA